MDKKLLSVAVLTGLLVFPAAPLVFAEDDFGDFDSGFDGGFGDDFGDDDGGSEDIRPVNTIWEVDFDKMWSINTQYVSDDSFQYGRYNGRSEKGFYLYGDLDLVSRPEKLVSDTAAFWTLRANNLGLDTSSLDFTGGQQGNYKISLSVNNMLSVGNDTGRTPFTGQGSDYLHLPANWEAANTTGAMGLDGNLFGVDPELARNQLSLQLVKQLDKQWSVTARFSHERKSGDKVTAGSFYINTANPHAAMLPNPVDYDNNQLDLLVDYVTDAVQMQFSYLHSELDNRYDVMLWQNPYNDAFMSNVDYPNGIGAFDLPSDLTFQQFRFNGNIVFSPKVKLRLDGSVGESELDDDFPSYTINPLLAVDTPLPMTSSSDTLDTQHMYASLLIRPSRSLYVNVKYRFDERKNGIQSYPWQFVVADSTNQLPEYKSVYNRSSHHAKKEYGIDGTWRLRGGSRLTVGYEYEAIDRNYSAVDQTEEDKVRVEFKTTLFDVLSTRLELGVADLGGDVYEWSQSFFYRYTADQINEIPDNQRFNDHPLLRQYQLANRESQYGKLNLGYAPNERWNFLLDVDYSLYDYDKSELGLTESRQTRFNFNASYMPSATLVAYAWIAYGQNQMDQSGRAYRGGVEKPANVVVPPFPQGSDVSRNWDLNEKDTTQSIGAGLDWQIVENKVVLVADYVYVNTSIEDVFDVYGARDLAGDDLPDLETRLHQLTLAVNYYWRPEWQFRFGYEYYRFVSEDWALDGVAPDTMNKVLWLGEESPNDVVNVLSLSASYRF